MSAQNFPSRRLLLTGALAAGGLGLGAISATRISAQTAEATTPECHDGDVPTKPDIEGPYFKPRSPQRADLVESGARGPIVQLEGFVLSRSCRPVAGALLDFWHANENGDYDNSGFRYRGHLFSDAAGRYHFRTVIPGPYPGRTRHYHFKVQAPRRPILTTQLYFPDEPGNLVDDYFSPRLLMEFDRGTRLAFGRFDFILDIA